MKQYIVIFIILILFSCKSTVQNEELKNIRKSIENFKINEDFEKVIEYFNCKSIQYSLLKADEILNKEIAQYIENDDKIIYSVYYKEESNKIIKIIAEEYYVVHIIFNENNELKKTIFSELYLGL